MAKMQAEEVTVTGQDEQGYVEKVVKKAKVFKTSIETSFEEVVSSIEKGMEIVWYKEDLPDLSDDELAKLPYKVGKAYSDALAARKEEERKALGKVQTFDILGGNALNKLKLRKRRGYHQTWKRPDEFDEAQDNGYVVIRKSKDGDKVGYEKGDIMKIGLESDPELIAMEIRQDVYNGHIQAVSLKSRRAYTNMKEGFASSIENVNRALPKGSERVTVVDDEGDVGKRA